MSFLQLINQNSYTFAALTIFSISLVVVLARFRQLPAAWGTLIGLALMLIAGNLVMRVGMSEIETTAQFDQILSTGKPVVLEIYSNY